MRQAKSFHSTSSGQPLHILIRAGLPLIALGIALGGGSGARAQSTTTIEVGDDGSSTVWFCDSSFQNAVCETTASVGDTLIWEWGLGGSGTDFPHTTTACSSDFTTCGSTQGWDSGDLSQISGSFAHTFTEAGTFYYKCLVHPGPSTPFMRGKITVAAAAEPSPSPQVSPQPSPPPSPQPSTLSITPTPADLQPTAVPAGGGAPPADGGTSMLWWLAMVAGAFLVASWAAVLTLRRLRR